MQYRIGKSIRASQTVGMGEQVQTRLCGLSQDGGDAPIQVSGSRPIGDQLPALLSDITEWLHYRSGSISWSSFESIGSKAPRCRYDSTTSRVVNACWGRFVKKSFVDHSCACDPNGTLPCCKLVQGLLVSTDGFAAYPRSIVRAFREIAFSNRLFSLSLHGHPHSR